MAQSFPQFQPAPSTADINAILPADATSATAQALHALIDETSRFKQVRGIYERRGHSGEW